MAYAKRKTAEERAALVAQWECSGSSVAEFCRQHEIKEGTFDAWRRAVASTASPEAATVQLVEIGVSVAKMRESIEVVLPNGICVRVPAGFERRSLEEILDVVRSC
jgi:transposase-like protein